MEFTEILAIIIPSLVTILGFVVSYTINKKEHYQSIQIIKTEKQVEDLYSILRDVFKLIDMLELMIAYPQEKLKGFDELKEKINTTVICTGSNDAVKIMVHIREMSNTGIDDGIHTENACLIAGYVLLAMQIKYDVTGVESSPDSWYKGRYTTQKIRQSGFYDRSVLFINSMVDQLELKPFLRIREGACLHVK